MDHQTSHELLAHFDRPKAVDCPDFEWVEDADETPEAFVEVVKIAPSAGSALAFEPSHPSGPSQLWRGGILMTTNPRHPLTHAA